MNPCVETATPKLRPKSKAKAKAIKTRPSEPGRASIFDRLSEGGKLPRSERVEGLPGEKGPARGIAPKAKAKSKNKGKPISSDLLARLSKPRDGEKGVAPASSSAVISAIFPNENAAGKDISGDGQSSVGVETEEQVAGESAANANTCASAKNAGSGGSGGSAVLHSVLIAAAKEDAAAAAAGEDDMDGIAPVDGSVRARLRKFADCGVLTAEQLRHAVRTRASKGCNLPYSSYFNGRQLLLNELIGR
eukprot:SAG11_NODE_338_length_10535_cov_8.199885_13_plen_248_part_00